MSRSPAAPGCCGFTLDCSRADSCALLVGACSLALAGTVMLGLLLLVAMMPAAYLASAQFVGCVVLWACLMAVALVAFWQPAPLSFFWAAE